MLNRLTSNFSGNRFARTIVARRAQRAICDFLDKFGQANVMACVQKDKLVTDFIDQQHKVYLKQLAMPYLEALQYFSDEEIATNWMPPKYLALIKPLPGGNAYLLRQAAEIRSFLRA